MAFWGITTTRGIGVRGVVLVLTCGVTAWLAIEGVRLVEGRKQEDQAAEAPVAPAPAQTANPNPFRDTSKETIAFIMGGNVVPIPRPFLFDKPYLIPLQGILGDPAFNTVALHLKNDRPIADVKLWGDGEGHYDMEVIQNNFVVQPKGWDFNFNDDGFEVVDADRRPILQIYYKSENEIIIAGVFRGPFDMIYVSETGIQTRHIGAGGPPPLKRMFRYPSEQYKGKLSQDWKAPY